jgi:murein DD-endopeptidase MepM/ murein hydrolase activator NlpD
VFAEDAPSAHPAATPPRQAVSLRWLAGCLLTGIAGAGLLGAALALAVSGETEVAPPERVAWRQDGATENAAEDGRHGDGARKGDRLMREAMTVAAKQSFRAPVTERVGEREVIRNHAYVQVATDLSARPPDEPVPPFDPMRTGAAPEALPPDDGTDPAETAVTLTRSPLAGDEATEGAPALADAEVDALVAEAARAEGGALPLLPAERLLSRALRAGLPVPGVPEPEAAFGSIEVRILPENLTEVPENPAEAAPLVEERDVVLGKDETLEAALRANGAAAGRIAAILPVLSARARGELEEGQHLRLLLGPEGEGRAIQRVTLYGEAGIEEIVAMNDRGRFVSVAPPRAGTEAARGDDEDAGGATLYQSLYGAGLRNGVPRPIIEELMLALAYGTDLQQRVASGDRVEMLFTEDEDSRPELVFAALRLHGDTQALYRYRVPGTGEVDYLDAHGRSSRKFLMRRPVADGRISSPFGARYHPILGYLRPHNGVDWAATRGTPIMATGDGTILSAGARSGYGNRVEIQHANGYTSAYNHMARIARGVVPGARVRLGQVIGGVGTTGLSTGPHVHYEVTINGRFVDPMKIRLPSARELAGSALAAFRQAEEQVDALRRSHGAKAVAARI